jgi:CheY-like chemotaxis protein
MIDSGYCKTSQFDIDPGAYVDIEFRDTGTGIDPKNIDRIFDPFFTTKNDSTGTGLGLSSVYGTVAAHKGAITVYSEPGTGTSFHILLPLSYNETEDIPATDQSFITGSGRILLVDDEESIRITGAAILEDLGYEVTLGINGQHGLEIFEAAPDDFDLVILDMIMPKMNGRECFSALQNIRKGVRVIISSGFTREHELQPMMEQGLKGFIRKPFRAAELSVLVHKVLHPIS